MTDSDKVKLLPCEAAERIRGIIAEMRYAVGGGMSWISFEEAVGFTASLERIAEDLTRPPVVTDKVVERVARAIYEHLSRGSRNVPWDNIPQMAQDYHRDQARAVLKAIASMPAVVSGEMTDEEIVEEAARMSVLAARRAARRPRKSQ